MEEAETPTAPEDLLKLAAELPEELRALVEEAMAGEITAPAAPAGETAPAEVELPPWLAEMAEEEEGAEVISAPAEEAAPARAEEEEIPPWLRELAQKETAAQAPAEEPEEEAVPPWLESRLEEAGPSEAGIPAEEETPVEEIPEWLQRLRQAAIQDMPSLKSELAAGEEMTLEQETGVPAHELEPTPAVEETPSPEEEAGAVVSASMLEEIWMAAAEGMPLIHEEEIAPVPQALEAETPAEAVPASAEEKVEEAPVSPAEERAVEELPSPSPFIAQAQERLRVRPDDHEMRLALARAWRDAGQIESALQEYSTLVEADQFVESIVSDLEHLIAELGEEMGSAPAWTVLGDAYMRQGRLSDALDAYRRALGRRPA
ncbi:MAG: tetratricopeptide repeat protein [Anaerolineae bacterium]|nr:tetratricopeptide repeat protein [Anaerolineae bacterium]